MVNAVNIAIKNMLLMEKRGINVYHHSTKSAHLISHTSSITIPIKPFSESDYLHISAVSGPGDLEGKCLINLPSWADFEFCSTGDVTVIHSGNRTLLKIPPGPPTWQLKITRPISSLINQPSDHITISDDSSE